MTYLPRVAAAKSAEWIDLVDELDRWEEARLVAQLWWRDDDAAVPTPALDRLLTLAGPAPLALAVIPADAKPSLAAALGFHPQVSVLHHGWCHANRAAATSPGGKKSEYPAERHPVDVADELDEGRKQLRALFGSRALGVFVPPWNRFAERFVPLLKEAGFVAISQIAPRKTPAPRGVSRGIAAIDVHLDVVDWHEGRGFVGDAPALGRLVGALEEERRAAQRRDKLAAVGLLTHHLVMDNATEDFIARLGELVATHAAALWVDIRELMR
ncbi:MAG TPA: polysaccharide deacetylase family protein [Stellaceae bacterium]|nr:polysaccharide deacetylase family protein [Stellaceae bacterium]